VPRHAIVPQVATSHIRTFQVPSRYHLSNFESGNAADCEEEEFHIQMTSV